MYFCVTPLNPPEFWMSRSSSDVDASIILYSPQRTAENVLPSQ